MYVLASTHNTKEILLCGWFALLVLALRCGYSKLKLCYIVPFLLVHGLNLSDNNFFFVVRKFNDQCGVR